jgi:hypothetical protein
VEVNVQTSTRHSGILSAVIKGFSQNASIKEMEIKKGIKTDWGQNKKVNRKKSNKEAYL